MNKHRYAVNSKVNLIPTEHHHGTEKQWGSSGSNSGQRWVWTQSHNVLYFSGSTLRSSCKSGRLVPSCGIINQVYKHMATRRREAFYAVGFL